MASTQTRNRDGPFGLGAGSSKKESTRPVNTGFISRFGAGADVWSGGIWSNNAIGSGLKSNIQENGRVQNESGNLEAITGSGSLLSSSESDGYNLRHGSWNSLDDTSPSLSRVHTNHSNTSPVLRQHGKQLVPPNFDSSNSAYYSLTPASANISSRSSQKNFLDPTSGSFVATGTFNPNQTNRSSRHNSDEESRYAARKIAFEGSDAGLNIQSGLPTMNTNLSGYNSSVASRSGSQPPSRSDIDHATRRPSDMQSNQHSRFATSVSSSYRPGLSAQAPSYNMPSQQQRPNDQLSQTQLNQLLGDFGNLNVGRENQNPYATYREAPYPNSISFGNNYSHELTANGSEVWNREENGYQGQQPQFSPTESTSGSLISQQNSRRPIPFANQYTHSSSNSDARVSHHSPYYSTAGTPPTYQQQRGPSRGGYHAGPPTGEAALLDHKLRGLQQEQQAYMIPSSKLRYRYQYSQQNPYDFQPARNVPPNQVNQYYSMPPNPSLLAGPPIPRGPARDHDLAQPVRSPLLEEFRNNSKTNKRYELKDIYDHIVEFSGDQHGSRFIQQKLETANSDEKDQVFRELYPNAIQLMTDVFGNYVIQKFFEHGNQSQKKVLANQMRNHILSLSKQMYGCRVVQKALEHILTDQQAQLIKELENDVINCVKDQNGNHVVQKAIERVPAEHIQFIINAFTGQVQILATHSYGCRVVQRMLEHCEEPTRSAILSELHACAASLIVDQFGNYVTQHVIEHGADEDRGKLISLVVSQLSSFSKHKFASNVVEKSIEFGSKEERQKIVANVTAVNDRGESPSLSLIRDQYGNYVIQKLLNTLKDSEREEFVELIKAQIALLKRFSYGKQIAAIEKLIYTSPFPQQSMQHDGLQLPHIDTSAAPTPPLSIGAAQSPQSSLPSTHANSIDEPTDGSRKSSGSNAVGVMTPNST